MKSSGAFLALVAAARAHYTFPSIAYGGVQTAPWQYVRETANYQSNAPVTDVTSPAMTCYQLKPGNEGALTMNVSAATVLTYDVKVDISHPGVLQAYMAKAPGAVSDFDGSGNVWFKIYEDAPTITASGMSWPSEGKTTVQFEIPQCIADGQYLFRVEHIALHSASTLGGAQLYLSCAQLSVSGGTGTYQPNLMAFPGAYKATDPGLLINIYYPIPKNYTAPGGPPLVC